MGPTRFAYKLLLQFLLGHSIATGIITRFEIEWNGDVDMEVE